MALSYCQHRKGSVRWHSQFFVIANNNSRKNILYHRYKILVSYTKVTELLIYLSLQIIMQYAQFCKSSSSKCYTFPSLCGGKGTLFPWGINNLTVSYNCGTDPCGVYHWQTDWQGRNQATGERHSFYQHHWLHPYREINSSFFMPHLHFITIACLFGNNSPMQEKYSN